MDLSFGCFFLWINAIKLLPVLIIFLQEQIPEFKKHTYTHLLFAPKAIAPQLKNIFLNAGETQNVSEIV